MMLDPLVIAQTRYFLKNGRFNHALSFEDLVEDAVSNLGLTR